MIFCLHSLIKTFSFFFLRRKLLCFCSVDKCNRCSGCFVEGGKGENIQTCIVYTFFSSVLYKGMIKHR